MPTRQELEELTVADLRKLASDVEGSSKLRKAELIDALADDPDAGPSSSSTIPAGTVDPALERQREDARKIEANTRVGRVRHAEATIDPTLVEIREETIRRDAASVQPSTAPPTR